MADVRRSAITNWEQRHSDFPKPTNVAGTEYYSLPEMVAWLDSRPVPSRARRADEPVGVTYADRARVWIAAASQDEATKVRGTAGFPLVHHPAAQKPGEEDRSAVVNDLLREQSEGSWGSAPQANFLYLLLSLVFLRWAGPGRWADVRRHATADRGGRFLHRALPAVARNVERILAELGVPSGVGARLEGLTAHSRRALLRLLDRVEMLERGDFAELLSRYALQAGMGSQDAFTPPAVASLLAELLDPGASDRSVYDPNCRGGELLSAVLTARQGQGFTPDTHAPAVSIGSANLETRVLAVMNLMVHGVRPERQELTGIPAPWAVKSMPHRFDLVLANPPFNVPVGAVDPSYWAYGEPPASNANLAWPQHAVMSLNRGGRAVVLMPNSAAVSSNSKEQRIRHALVERGVVECVVALPAKLFSTTAISVNAWILKPETQEKGPGKVLFVNASGLGAQVSRKLSVLETDDRALIVNAYRSWRASEEGDTGHPDLRMPSVALPREAVIAHGSSLNPADYAPLPSQPKATADEVAQAYADLLRSGEKTTRADDRVVESSRTDRWSTRTERDSSEGQDWQRLGDLCQLQAGPSPALLRKEIYVPAGEVPVVQPTHLRDRRITDARSTSVSYRTEERMRRFALSEGDILCARTGTVGPVAQVGADQVGWLFGTNLMRLHTFGPEVFPPYLLAYLSLPRTVEWIKSRSEKTTVPSISKSDLQSLLVPIPSWPEQRRIAVALGELDEQITAHREAADAASRMRGALAEQLMCDMPQPGTEPDVSPDVFSERIAR
ncbi:N-6 DNA methylase [Streptomyces sp. NPDC059080]|uniref:type I restriction-modification system subunit M/S n=1 Tax=Streptomyces sp. NPDC059080 TaxID=3346718 RepID=UPI0036A4B5BF